MVRLTPEVCDKLGLKRDLIIRGIEAKTIPGQQLDEGSRVWLIDDDWYNKHIPKPQEVIPEVPKDNAIIDIETEIEQTKKQQELEAQKIKLEEVKGLRAKPEVLKQIELELKEKSDILTKKEEALRDKELALNYREEQVKIKEKIADNAIIEVQKSIDEILSDFELEVLEKNEELDKLSSSIEKKNKLLAYLLDILLGYENASTPLIVELKGLMQLSNTYANHYDKWSQKTKGTQSEYWSQKSDKGFDLAEKFKKLLKGFGVG
jgi:hypothetical protein